MNAADFEAIGETLASLQRRLEQAFSPDTAAQGFPGATPSTGHCAAVTTIVYEMLGGDMISTLVDGHSHWLNRLEAGGRSLDVDLTGDQFGRPRLQIDEAGKLYPDTRVRSASELTEETLARARLLAKRAGLSEVVQAIEVQMKERSTRPKGR